MELLERIVKNIENLRKEKGWTVEKLARTADIPTATLNGIRQRKYKDIHFSTVIAISDALGCTTDDLRK